MKRRGSFKIGPGVRANWSARSGITSVNVGGVRLGGSRRRSSSGGRRGGRPPSRAALVAQVWQVKPGLHYVRMSKSGKVMNNFLVDGAELTYDRFIKFGEAAEGRNADTMVRIARTFIRAWDVQDDGGKRLPIGRAAVERVSPAVMLGIVMEIARSLGFSRTLLNPVMFDPATNRSLDIVAWKVPPDLFNHSLDDVMATLSTAEPPATATRLPSVSQEDAKDEEAQQPQPQTRQKTVGSAYAWWLFTGFLGGHRYYLGCPVSGFLMTITLGGLLVWWVIDALLLPGMVKRANQELP